jgi:hypothetical protein
MNLMENYLLEYLLLLFIYLVFCTVPPEIYQRRNIPHPVSTKHVQNTLMDYWKSKKEEH